MSKTSKSRTFYLTGTTAPLVDGKPRDIVLVAVLNSQTVIRSGEENIVKDHITKDTLTVIKSKVLTYKTVTEHTLSFGLSVTAPMDKFDQKTGLNIAIGKASKEKSALATLKTDDTFFTKTLVMAMLEAKLSHIKDAPDKFIKVSPAKLGEAISIPAIDASGATA